MEGPWVVGVGPNPGSRTDLASLKSDVDDHKDWPYLWDNHFKTMVKYHKAIQVYALQKVKPRDFSTTVFWLWGVSGEGKSTLAKKLAAHLGGRVFYKTVSMKEWYDGYDGQDVIVWDDFNASHIKYTALMQMTGNDYPMRVQIKGTSCHYRAKYAIFTSIKHPSDVYKPGLWEHGLKRRCAGSTYYVKAYKPYKTDETSLTISELDELIPESW